MADRFDESFLTTNIYRNNRDRGKRWGITWFGDGDGLEKSDLYKIRVKLELFPHMCEFVFQMEICTVTGKLHIHAALGLDKKEQKPIPRLKKLFPGVHIQHALDYRAWQSFCCKKETRVPGTKTQVFGVELKAISPYIFVSKNPITKIEQSEREILAKLREADVRKEKKKKEAREKFVPLVNFENNPLREGRNLVSLSKIRLIFPGINTILQEEEYTYLVGEGTDFFKIGRSKTSEKRLKELQTSNPRQLTLIACCPGGHVEKEFHVKYNGYRCEEGGREWFKLNPEILFTLLHDFLQKRIEYLTNMVNGNDKEVFTKENAE